MATWTAIASSPQCSTNSSLYKCFVNVSRDTSNDSGGVAPEKSLYLFQMYIIRIAAVKFPHSRWTRRHTLTGGIDSGNVVMYWPESTSGINMQANTPTHLFSFQAELTNDGSAKTVSMLASCENSLPRDCNVTLTFNTAKRSIKPSNPTNVRWASHILSSGNIRLSWDKSDNAIGYYIQRFVNNVKKGDALQTQDTTYIFKNIDDFLNPTDVFHVRVESVSATGDKSYAIESPQLRYGDMARIKSGSDRLYAQPYVKPLGTNKFKPVRAVWIKTINGWARAIDD